MKIVFKEKETVKKLISVCFGTCIYFKNTINKLFTKLKSRNKYKTRDMCNRVVAEYPMLEHVQNHFKTQEMCSKAVAEDTDVREV